MIRQTLLRKCRNRVSESLKGKNKEMAMDSAVGENRILRTLSVNKIKFHKLPYGLLVYQQKLSIKLQFI
jgi:hypothetical protein